MDPFVVDPRKTLAFIIPSFTSLPKESIDFLEAVTFSPWFFFDTLPILLD